ARRRLNIHPSLVPECRGNDNAAWTIRRGVPAGVSLLEMDATLDTGGVYAQRVVDYEFPMRGSELQARLLLTATELFKDEWPAIHAESAAPRGQGNGGSYHLRKQTNADRMIDADEILSADELVMRILAHDFSPRTTAEFIRNGRHYKARILL